MKSITNRILAVFGVRLQRTKYESAPMFSDALSASLRIERDQRAAFIAETSKCVIFNGLSYGKDGWHPYVQATREYLQGIVENYSTSILGRYHQMWKPTDGQAALIGATAGPGTLAEYPPYLIHAPWLKNSPSEQLRSVSKIIEMENADLGVPGMGIDKGIGLQGPVSTNKGELEFARLALVSKSIRDNGYDRRRGGDITAQVLVRGNEIRYRIVHGHHRIAAMAALGFSNIVCVPNMIVRRDQVAYWWQVRSGFWNEEEALSYFDHHFDFDSLNWASEMGLLKSKEL